MNAKKLLSIALLLFVAAAVVTILVRQTGDETNVDKTIQATTVTTSPAVRLVAYYLHGETRCPTCRTIEAYAHEAIEASFSDELKAGQIKWQVVNYEVPANEHFTTDYEIVAPTVVLVRTVKGEPAEWRNLSRVWNLVDEKQAFAEYLQSQVREMLDGPTG